MFYNLPNQINIIVHIKSTFITILLFGLDTDITTMAKSKKYKTQGDGVHKMRQFYSMVKTLHEMLQSLGQQSVGDTVIKLDEFQKLRRAFTSSAQTYESCNNQIKSMSDRVLRAQLMFSIIQSKKTMQGSLGQMTTISIKLKEKIQKEQVRQPNMFKTPQKKKDSKKQWQTQQHLIISDNIEENEQEPKKDDKSPLEKQLQYKTLVLYNLQRVFYQLVKTERKEVASTRKDIVKNKFAGLEELKQEAEKRKLMGEFQNEELNRDEEIQQQEILQAIRRLDDEIESKMVPILQGIDKMHGHSIGISNSIGNVHKMILVNLEMTDANQIKLQDAQKMLDKVTPHARKPSCICNVVLCFLLALVAFLVLKLFGVFGDQNSTPQ